ncbi:MAG: hypothetical protein EWV40_10190 [Microcystis flos-aquae Mf_WU_F_19750830_S460]|uniref:Uncharacterized protein n=1 Tax=Microcystis flos-aquae Mf_WU_F_19750830_S460 TaxID=2486237 RepID=A0A552LQ67_9CHRO|nr:MAG: hypothetical protein EWV40_10190 [Microcystis flos-aquae Mf_WU_F_19750830_S460]
MKISASAAAAKAASLFSLRKKPNLRAIRETALNQLSVISYQLSDVSFHCTDYCSLFTVH